MNALSIVMCSGTALLVTGMSQTMVAPDETYRIPARRAACAAVAAAAAAIVFAVGAATIRPAGIATVVTGAAALLAVAWGRSDFTYWRMLRTAKDQNLIGQPIEYATFAPSCVTEPPIIGAQPAVTAGGIDTRPITSCDATGPLGSSRSTHMLQRARPGD